MRSAGHLANYAVKSHGLQIAWFLVDDDAHDFVKAQLSPRDYSVVRLDN